MKQSTVINLGSGTPGNQESESTVRVHLDAFGHICRLSEASEPRTESRAVRALLTTGGPRIKKLHGRYVEDY